MAAHDWPLKYLSVTTLQLDTSNPRLGPDASGQSPHQLIQELFENDKAMDVARSIVRRGYFPNEPLLAIRDGRTYIVIEGNRRLAALKALRDPELLEGTARRQIARLANQISDIDSLSRVPVVVAPNRRDTDPQVAGRHVGTPVLPWPEESRANFVLNKLEEGYSDLEITTELGFSAADIGAARRTHAVVDAIRSLDLPPDIRALVDDRQGRILSTIQRVFDSTVGRSFLGIKPDRAHGFRGTTSAPEFTRALTRLVTDVAEDRASSRSLNTNEDMKTYFGEWSPADLPKNDSYGFVPADLTGPEETPERGPRQQPTPPRQPPVSRTVVPSSFSLTVSNERLIEIRKELTRLNRAAFPNAGAVLLRVFVELSVIEYLQRSGEMARITGQLRAQGKLRGDTPMMSQLVPDIIRIAKDQLPKDQANEVEKALTPNRGAPFGVEDMNSFVHNLSAFPGERDIQTFWHRVEPLLSLMVGRNRKDECP